MDLSSSKEISTLIKSFVKSCPPWEVKPPEWEVSSLFPLSDFVAKTQNSSVPDDRFDRLSVPSLQDFIDNDLDEMALCPVRAVQLHLKRTQQFHPVCKCLFISTGQYKKEVSKNTLSGFVR